MTTPMPDGFSPELLAAYADGELDAPTRAAVERWLADHPEAREAAEAQRELAANSPLWEQTAPREPSEAAWAVVRRGIDAGLTPAVPAPPKHRRVAGWVLAGLSTAGIAAAALWFALGPTAPPPPPRPVEKPVEVAKADGPEVGPEPRVVYRELAPTPNEVVSFPIASDDEVVLHRVPELVEAWLPVGQHPLTGAISLAAEVDFQLAELAPSSVWPPGGPRMTIAPGDAPMIYAAKLR